MIEVFGRYYEKYASKLPSAESAKKSLWYWTEFFGDITVDDISIDRQEEFVEHLRGLGQADGYVSRILSVGRSALNRARKRGEIRNVPFIPDVMDEQDRRDRDPKGRPLTMAEVGRILDSIDDIQGGHMMPFCMVMMNTVCRPDAALDLQSPQLDWDSSLVQLNPPGRKQTKKFRPIVPMTETLKFHLADTDGPIVSDVDGELMESVKKAWRGMRKRAGLEEDLLVQPYSFRHTMGRALRKQGAPGEQIELMMGHIRPTGRSSVTSIYAPYEPDYCRDVVIAIDRVMTEVQQHTRRRILPPQKPVVISTSNEPPRASTRMATRGVIIRHFMASRGGKTRRNPRISPINQR